MLGVNPRWTTTLGLLTITLFTAFGCGSEVGNDGPVVGGSCVVNSECAFESQCRTGDEWPAGYCAKLCDSDADCPNGSVCTDSGNFCLVECGGDGDCRADDGYRCVARDRRGAGGTANVCASEG